MAAIVGKVVENVKLSNLPSCPSALSWSPDERISVVTDQCVYVLTPTCTLSPRCSRTGIDVEKTYIPRRKESLVLDVGLDREKLLATKTLQCYLDPCVNLILSNHSGFCCAAWSPLNCDKNGRCIIATLASDYQLCIHLSPTLGIKWEEVADLSQILASYLKLNAFKINWDIMPPDQSASPPNKHSRDASKSLSSKEYSLFKQRTEMLSFTCLHWFSQLYSKDGEVLSNGVDDSSSLGSERFAVLATASRSGHVMFWRIALPVVKKSTATVSVGGVLDTQLSWPCCLAWQTTGQSQGLLAVGSTDGLVKVFSLNILPGSSTSSVIRGVAQYVLWGDRDDVCPQLLNWLPEGSGGCHHLVVCKGAAVIVFSVSVKDGLLIKKPTHKLVRGVHRMPITGMTCSRDHAIFTCSMEGSVQKISVGDMTPTAVQYDFKRGFLCNGIGRSANGVFMALFQTPSNSTLQSLESHRVHILFVNLLPKSSISQLLRSDEAELQRKWDVYKALQNFLYKGNQTTTPEVGTPEVKATPEVDAFCSSDASDTCSLARLILRQHVLSLRVSAARDDDSEPTVAHHKWSAELARTTKHVRKSLVSSTLTSWLKGRWEGTVNNSDSVSALVMCDWLVKNFSDSFALDMVSEVYKACNDSEGLRMVSASLQNNQKIVTSTSLNRTLDEFNLHEALLGTSAHGAGAHRIEAMGEPMETRQTTSGSQETLLGTSARAALVHRTEAMDEPMETAQNTSGNLDNAGGLSLRNGSLKEVFPNETEAVIGESESLVETEFPTVQLSLPARETCPVCESPIAVENLDYGSCLNGHEWPRCGVTFTVCSALSCRLCQDCNRCVVFPGNGMSPWLRGLLERTTKCPLCWGWFNSPS